MGNVKVLLEYLQDRTAPGKVGDASSLRFHAAGFEDIASCILAQSLPSDPFFNIWTANGGVEIMELRSVKAKRGRIAYFHPPAASCCFSAAKKFTPSSALMSAFM